MSKTLRIAFMGTPDFSTAALQKLIDSAHDVVCVYSQPPRPKGRGKKVQASPVHVLAEENNIEVRTPFNFKNEADIEAFQSLELDIAVVAAYGLILPKAILEAPKHGCINIHASLLPRWRGAAPIHRAIWAGDEETGVTLMQMDEGLDTGDMIAMEKIAITQETILQTLHDDLGAMGASMIVPCLDELAVKGSLKSTPQPQEGMTYAKMLSKEDGRVNWNVPAQEIDRQVRGLNPWPGTWSHINDKRIKILGVQKSDQKTDKPAGTILENGEVACGEGTVLKLMSVQPENKKPMDMKVAMNGSHLAIGDVLS